jgi:hypothetical protein
VHALRTNHAANQSGSVLRTIDLYQLSETGASLTHLMDRHFPRLLRFPQFFGNHQLSHTLVADLQAV